MKEGETQKKPKPKGQRVSASLLLLSAEKDYLIDSLSILVSSGMGVLAAAEAMVEEAHSRRVRQVLVYIRDSVNAGIPLWQTLSNTKLFNENTISLIRIGEESGRLSENLKLVAEQERKNRAFKSKIRSAMMYPVFVLVLAVTVGIGASWFVLPRLAVVFNQLNVELPAISKIMIAIGEFMGDYGLIFSISMTVGMILLLVVLFGIPATRFLGQGLLLRTPGVRRMMQEVEISRFGFILGTLITAGVPIIKALESLSKSTSLIKYRDIYTHLRDQVEQGKTFKDAFANYKGVGFYIPVSVQQMVVSGEQSGNLAEMLQKFGAIYEERLETTAKDLATVLEPILLLIVSLAVLGLALSIILPIYRLLGSVDRRGSVQDVPITEELPVEEQVFFPPQEEIIPEIPEAPTGTVENLPAEEL